MPAQVTNLNVRNFSPDLLRKIKVSAAVQGKTLRQWVIEAVQDKLRRVK
jgi:predicted HicB family RNase H-like nuclease